MTEILTGGSWAGGWNEPGTQFAVIIGPGTAGSGWFIYSGTPGPGNAPVEWGTAPGVTVDPYGNSLPASDIVSFSSVAGRYAQLSGGEIVLHSGAGPNTTTIQARSVSPNMTTFTGVPVAYAFDNTALVTELQASAPGGPFTTAETWHSLGTLTGYTVGWARYRLVPQNNEVEFDISISATGTNTSTVTFSNTLPAAYRPTNGNYTLQMSTNLAIASWTAAPPRLGVTTAGVVTFNFMTNQPSGTNFGPNENMPTD